MYKKAILTLAGIVVCGFILSCTHTVKVESTKPVVIDLKARIDIYQHAVDIEDMVSGEKPLEEEQKPQEKDSSLLRLLGVESLWAAEYSSESLEAIKRRKARYSEIRSFKQKGYVGENNQGLLEIRDRNEDGKLQDLVNKENQDREIIYQEVLRKQQLPAEALSQIRFDFARANRQRSKPGEWIQAPEDEKEFSKFKGSALATKLGEKVEPGKWYTIPEE